MNKMMVAWFGLLCALGALCPQGIRAAEAGVGGTYTQWQRHRDAVLKEPGLLRYYTFEDARGGAPIANLAGKTAPLAYAVERGQGGPDEPMQVIEGRWPGKRAVRLDRGYLHAEPFDVPERRFTVEAWFRKNGPGSLKGNPGTVNGTLLSVGIGYWDGWRLTTSYPVQSIGFEIGRPKPSSSFGIHTPPVADGVWHHLAATWDGQEMRVYVDGLLASSGLYSGAYTPAEAGLRFRVGYSGHGFGSVRLDIDEVAIYDRPLPEEEILRRAHFHAPLPEALGAKLRTARAALAARDYGTATAGFTGILSQPGVHADWAALARLGLGSALLDQQKHAAATTEFLKVANASQVAAQHRKTAFLRLTTLMHSAGDALPRDFYEALLASEDASTADRVRARFELARALRRDRDFAGARSQYAKVVQSDEVTPRQKLDARLEMAHTAWEAGDFAGARALFAQLATAGDAPAAYRGIAGLRIAESYARQRNYAAAKAEFTKLQARQDVPPHHRWEAGERLREITRVLAGLPARDPAANRVRLPAPPKPAVTFYVAPNGADTNSGAANSPFATLARARDAIRALKSRGPLPQGGVAVVLRAGEYPIRETLALTEADSGTAGAPIVYRAAEGESVRLTGGARVRGIQPVRDPAILERIPAEARAQVRQVDLRAQGITDLGTLRPQGMGFPATPVMEVFYNGTPLIPARWPNEGFTRVAKVVDAGASEENRGITFECEGDRPARWQQARDAWVFGYWRHDWADATVAVAAIDAQTGRIRTAPLDNYGIQSGCRFYALNLLEEIDRPGESYLDRQTGILYFYPPSDPAKATLQVSLLEAPFLRLENVSHVTFQGLTLELGRAGGVEISGGERCLLAGCVIRQLGGTAAVVVGGAGHGILGCDLHTLGRGGAIIRGGDRKTLTPGGHFIENCHIHHFSRVARTYTPAVLMDGVGNRIAHNLIHESPGHGMRLEGNDHVVEFNEVHSVVYESDDQAGIDMWFNPTYRGNIIRYNFWHHIGSGLTRAGQSGIRLDDAISGVLIYGNVFYRASGGRFGGVQIHGGKENVVDNNLFVDCRYGISFSPWGEQGWKRFLERPNTQKALQDVAADKPPYSTRYPELARLPENPDVNSVWRNLAVNTGDFLTRDRDNQDVADNLTTGRDPGFVDPARRDFRLKPNAPVLDRNGFRPIPFAEIGLYPDKLRASWPVTHQVSPHYVPRAAE